MAVTLERLGIERLAAGFRGTLLGEDTEGYEEARAVYNAMIDRRPVLIARCRDAADVMAAVGWGRDAGLEIAVRGGGHNAGGLGTVDEGLVVDLGEMRGIRVDPRARLATVEGGARLGDLDHATHGFGLATPSGTVSTTGVAGLSLGGGMGYLTRRLGLAIDNLVSVDVVLADGTFVTASEDEHEDLFWAVRGGGGNFGVVTSFTFRLHPVATVFGGPMLWPLEAAPDLLLWWREYQPSAPRELTGLFAFLMVPPGPPFPEELYLRRVCGIIWCHSGTVEEGRAATAAARDVAEPAFDATGELPLPALQAAFDELLPPGLHQYWRGDFFAGIPDEAIARHLEFAARLPSFQSGVFLFPVDGAAHDVGPEDTAYAYRDATWSAVVSAIDPDPAKSELLRSWTIDYWEALHPYSLGGAYMNFMMEEGAERARAVYRHNYGRLAEIKHKYDPGNLFHVNQNIAPAP